MNYVMCCPAKILILKHTKKKSPLGEHDEINMDGFRQAEKKNNIILQDYPLTSAGNSLTRHEYDCSSKTHSRMLVSCYIIAK
jgi:hypothetical protein